MKIQFFFLQPLAIRYRNTEEQRIMVDQHEPYAVFLYIHLCVYTTDLQTKKNTFDL